jgi:hypothetical protein
MLISASAQKVITGYCGLGEHVLEDGTRLVGHIPHRAPKAYLHVLFAPITSDLLLVAREQFGEAEAFECYTQFLKEYNGANFFIGSLVFNGVRSPGLISRSAAVRQPFDLLELNRFRRPPNAAVESVFIGSYNWDGSLIFIEPDGSIGVCSKADATPCARWPSLNEMVSGEIIRLAQFYDSAGRIIDESARRTPKCNLE